MSTKSLSNILICYFCLGLTTIIEAATLQDAKTLQADLTNGYNKRLRPVLNQDDKVTVNVGLAVVALQEFDEVLEKFSVVGVF